MDQAGKDSDLALSERFGRFHELVAHWAEVQPDAPALIEFDSTLSYATLTRFVDQAAAALASGDESKARLLLSDRHAVQGRSSTLQEDIERSETTLDSYRREISALEDRLGTDFRRESLAQARIEGARTTIRARQLMHGTLAEAAMAKLEKKVEMLMAKRDALDSADADYEEMMKRLHRILAKISEGDIHTGVISLEKDDPLGSPIAFVGMDPEAIRGMPVVLVDDVLNSGRTLIHAAKAILDHAPKNLSTAVLIDRFHRSFPIRADFCGLTLSTNLKEHISVVFGEEDAAYLD